MTGNVLKFTQRYACINFVAYVHFLGNSVETAKASEPGENGKRIVFQSGDDLNDDFGDLDYGSDGDVADDQVDNRKVNSTKKSKKRTPKATPKVVKFKGSSLL
ncbi:hypothetical protein AXG93_2016s1430 [Marchantia polymorpha subsp. ruderalis]|uniref:Uncharacterized protein n=1 Tax=Marchantia polymorpha subsp. ruderalis TaxID=1480154 RepID=A0A176VV98_MARPO|nr:hypothetical protein AXG93_2016s1430 [Marchantia polymorpha subsp. ruderalis]